MARLHQCSARRWCFSCWLDDDRAAGCKCSRDFASRQEGGKVPRRERGDHTDRLHDHSHAAVVRTRPDNLAVDAFGFFRIPLKLIRSSSSFAFGLSQRLTRFQRHRLSNQINAFTDQVCYLANDSRTLPRPHLAPNLKSPLGRLQSGVDIGFSGGGDRGQFVFCRRIGDRLCPLVRGLAPFAIYIEV